MKIKRLLQNKFISLGLIPVVLIGFWFAASLLLNNKISFSVLLYQQSKNEITSLPEKKTLLKGDKIKGEFKAKDNYLGLLLLRFDQYRKRDFSSEDFLVFRLRPKGESSWSYSNNYRSGLLDNNLLFPFGFPIIIASRDNVYEFEIESLLGNESNGVEINRKTTALFSGYQYPKEEITKNKPIALNFVAKKIATSFTNTDFLLSSLIYLVPFLAYLAIYLFSSTSSKRLDNMRYVISALVSVLIVVDIFRIKEIYLGVLIILIIGWLLIISINKLGSKLSFIIAYSLILLWTLLILFQIKEYQYKINVWVYVFLVVGLIQAVIEEKKLLVKKKSKSWR